MRFDGETSRNMKILIDVNHPSQVHLFKHSIWEWEKRGHEVLIVARDKDVTLQLLDDYELKHVKGTTRRAGLHNLLIELFVKTTLLTRIGRRFKPDVFLSLGSAPAAWAATLLGRPHLAFTDTEHSVEQLYLYLPFSARVYTPDCFLRPLGRKHHLYAGYHELAYLHPNRFTPDPNILEQFGLSSGKPFFIVRLVSFGATHDVNRSGLEENTKQDILSFLTEHGPVIVSSESEKGMKVLGSAELIPADKMHHLIAFATLLIAEGTTMASEAAMLGTPAITVTPHRGGNLADLTDKYELVKAIRDPFALKKQVVDFLGDSDLKRKYQEKRRKLLSDKIDVTAFIVEEVESFVKARS